MVVPYDPNQLNSMRSNFEHRRSRRRNRGGGTAEVPVGLPKDLEVPRDELAARVDMYRRALSLSGGKEQPYDQSNISRRSAAALIRHNNFELGILRKAFLVENGPQWAGDRSVAPAQGLEGRNAGEVFKPARRFICPCRDLFSSATRQAAEVYAVKQKPRATNIEVYHALVQWLAAGSTCPAHTQVR